MNPEHVTDEEWMSMSQGTQITVARKHPIDEEVPTELQDCSQSHFIPMVSHGSYLICFSS